jgi:hypothetical protein
MRSAGGRTWGVPGWNSDVPGYDGALIERPGVSGVQRLQPGDTLLDWKVMKIGPRFVLLARAGQQIRLDLSKESSPATRDKPRRRSIKLPHLKDARGER